MRYILIVCRLRCLFISKWERESVVQQEQLAFLLEVTDMCARCEENPAIIQQSRGTYASVGIAVRTCTGRSYLLSSGSACSMKMCQ